MGEYTSPHDTHVQRAQDTDKMPSLFNKEEQRALATLYGAIQRKWTGSEGLPSGEADRNYVFGLVKADAKDVMGVLKMRYPGGVPAHAIRKVAAEIVRKAKEEESLGI